MRKQAVQPGAKKNQMKRLADNWTGVRKRSLGRKFDVLQTTVGRQLKKIGKDYRKRKKTPKYSALKHDKAKNFRKKAFKHALSFTMFAHLDDEKHFTLSGHKMPVNTRNYTNNKPTCPDDVRFAVKEKSPKEVLVWIAISDRGMINSFFRL